MDYLVNDIDIAAANGNVHYAMIMKLIKMEILNKTDRVHAYMNKYYVEITYKFITQEISYITLSRSRSLISSMIAKKLIEKRSQKRSDGTYIRSYYTFPDYIYHHYIEKEL